MSTPLSRPRFAGNNVSWEHCGSTISVQVNLPIVDGIILPNEELAIMAGLDGGSSRAMVFTANGTLRFDLKNPYGLASNFAFYYFDYYRNTLFVTLASIDGDVRWQVDLSTGSAVRSASYTLTRRTGPEERERSGWEWTVWGGGRRGGNL